MADQTASDVLVERLIDWGVEVIFGLPGDGINGFMDALRTRADRLSYVHVRHEEVAAMAAVGYAKFTGKLGVCFATSGPGAVHLMNGLLDAKVEQAPVLAITGMTYHDLIGTSYLQDVNIDYLMNDIAVYNQRIMGPQHVTNVVDYACRTALAQRGPAHIAFPIDYQAAPADGGTRYMRNVPGHTSASVPGPGPGARAGPAQRGRRGAGRQGQGGDPGRGGRPRRGRRTGGGRGQARRPDHQGAARQGLRARRQPVHHRPDRAWSAAGRRRRPWRSATRC